jgi:hypothetical protein
MHAWFYSVLSSLLCMQVLLICWAMIHPPISRPYLHTIIYFFAHVLRVLFRNSTVYIQTTIHFLTDGSSTCICMLFTVKLQPVSLCLSLVVVSASHTRTSVYSFVHPCSPCCSSQQRGWSGIWFRTRTVTSSRPCPVCSIGRSTLPASGHVKSATMPCHAAPCTRV